MGIGQWRARPRRVQLRRLHQQHRDAVRVERDGERSHPVVPGAVRLHHRHHVQQRRRPRATSGVCGAVCHPSVTKWKTEPWIFESFVLSCVIVSFLKVFRYLVPHYHTRYVADDRLAVGVHRDAHGHLCECSDGRRTHRSRSGGQVRTTLVTEKQQS